MAKGGLKITFEIEPIVKLQCMAIRLCRNNKQGTCNLKTLLLDKDGRCGQFEKLNAVSTHTEINSRDTY